jgi:general secretion pathway protein B
VSLILDALRKADAERERGSVPGLRSQPVAPLSAEVPPKPRARPNWLWIAIGVAAGLAGAATWVMLGRDAPAAAAGAANAGTQIAQPGAPGAATMGTPAASGVPGPAAASDAGTAARSTGEPAIAEPAPWRPLEERKAPRAEPKDDTKAAPPTKDDTRAGQPTVAPAVEAPPVYAREQLPPHIRAELPQLAIGGSIYSSNPASRSLIVSGQLYREKERLTQDLSLEEIKLKSAVFSFRGYRYEVPF